MSQRWSTVTRRMRASWKEGEGSPGSKNQLLVDCSHREKLPDLPRSNLEVSTEGIRNEGREHPESLHLTHKL